MFDVIIIGSGPAGLSAAVYAMRAALDIAVAEKDYEGTGQIAESSLVDNYLGLPNISGYELGERFRAHAVSMGVPFLELEVTGIEPVTSKDNKRYFKLTFEDGTVQETKTVIYAAGAAPRRVKTEGAERLEGKGISYCAVCDGTFYKDKTVAVLGGGDTALDDACYLSDIAAKVYIIHRRDKFRGAKSTEELLRKKDNVAFLMNRKVTEISGDEKVTGVTLIPNNNPERNDIDPETERLPVDGIFVAYGSVPQTELLKGLAELDENGYVCAPESGETSCEGIYAAGDVRTKSLRQVSTAVSDGAYAAMTCADYIRNR